MNARLKQWLCGFVVPYTVPLSGDNLVFYYTELL